MINTLEIQKKLEELGFDPGPLDGVSGPLTRKAIRQFQKANGLQETGIATKSTFEILFPDITWLSDDSIPTDMPWLHEAHRYLDLEEVRGVNNNSTIMKWATNLDIGYSSDEVPWCGLFTGHCISSQLPAEPLPKNILGARKWRSFGMNASPQLGAILVFWRSSPASWKGHVGFYWAEDDSHYHVLGGNQNNSVNVKRIKKNRLLEARWPASVEQSNIFRLASKDGVLISVNEE